jgi:hypothetical protein
MRRASASLVAAVVVALSVPVAPVLARPAPIVHVHSSSRYDRTAESLARAAHGYAKTRASLITWTEVSADHRARVLHKLDGWHSYTPRGTDIGLSWRRETWKLRHRYAPALSPFHYTTDNGYPSPTQHAAVAALDRRSDGLRVLVLVAHLPSAVQWGDGWRATPQRGKVWRSSVADWNVDLRRHAWRMRLHRAFPDLAPTWRRDKLPRGGTHAGGRLIDATLTNGRGAAHLMADDASSDHRPYGERVYTPRRES